MNDPDRSDYGWLYWTSVSWVRYCPEAGQTAQGGRCALPAVANASAGGDCCPLAGNPINPATGNKVQREVDLAWQGGTFERWYNSADSNAGGFGPGWHHSLERSVQYTGSGPALVTRGDGRTVYFLASSTGAWETSKLGDGTLTGSAGSFTYRSPDGGVETFDAAGRLQSWTRPDGEVVSLFYDPITGLLSEARTRSERTLSFTRDASGRITRVAASDGTAIEYAYDTGTRLSAVTYPGSAIRQYVYDSPNGADLLTGIIDERGIRIATWAYDDKRRAVSSAHANGAEATTISGVGGSSPTVSVAGGASFTYQYQSAVYGRPIMYSRTGDSTSFSTYDSWGGLISKKDAQGINTAYTTDDPGHYMTVTEASGRSEARTKSLTWDGALDRLLTTQNAKTKIARTYDSAGNVVSLATSDVSTPSVTSSVTLTRTDGQVTSVDGPRTDVSDVTSIGYDSNHDLSTVTNAAGQTLTFASRDEAGRPLSVRDANGRTVTLTYGPRGEATSVSLGGSTDLFGYDAALNLTSVFRPAEGLTSFTYDDNSWLTEKTTPQGWKKRFTYDTRGVVTKQESFDALGTLVGTSSMTYDAMGRLTKTTGASTSESETKSYDASGNVTSVIDGLGNSVQYTYDGLNRVATMRDGLARVTTYGYDANDQLTSRTDARGHVTSYTIDGLGRRTGISSPDTGATSLTYNPAGMVTTVTDATGRTLTLTFDALGRETIAAYGDGKSETLGYDAGANGQGHLTSAMGVDGSLLAWTYDASGHRTSVMQSACGTSRTVSIARDSYGRATGATYPSGLQVGYSYDATGLAAGITVSGASKISSVTTAPFTGISGWTWGNGRVVSRPRNTNGQLTSFTVGTSARSVGYDVAGQVISIGGSAPRTFTYDKTGRLTASTGPEGNRGFAYDATGNRASIAVASTTTPYTINSASDRIASIGSGGSKRTFGYGADGRVTNDGLHTFQYDGRGRMTSIDGGTWRYGYDALGRRTVKSKSVSGNGWAKGDVNHDGVIDARDVALIAQMINGTQPRVSEADCDGNKKYEAADITCAQNKAQSDTTLFMYGVDGSLLGEYDGLGSVLREYVYFNGAPALVVKGGVTYYVDVDHLGAPRAVSNQAGQTVWTWESDPFGAGAANENPSGLGTFTMPVRLPGQYFDAESGLHYNLKRYYDPGTGRYLQPDPAGLDGGDNVYEYAGSAPTHNVDPQGAAYFAVRPLHWVPDIMLGWSERVPNYGFGHEHLFFEDGQFPSNMGFHGSGRFFGLGGLFMETDPATMAEYRTTQSGFNDCIMRMAAEATTPSCQTYSILPFGSSFNCQKWAQAVRSTYHALENDPAVQAKCGCDSPDKKPHFSRLLRSAAETRDEQLPGWMSPWSQVAGRVETVASVAAALLMYRYMPAMQVPVAQGWSPMVPGMYFVPVEPPI